MKIRDKLYIGIICYIISGVTVGLLIFWQFRLISEKLSVVAVVNDISNRMLDARRYEKNYLLYRSNIDLDEFYRQMSTLKKEIEDIKLEFEKQIGYENYNNLRLSIEDYEKTFMKIINNNNDQNESLKLMLGHGIDLAAELSASNPNQLWGLIKSERSFIVNKDAENYNTLVRFIREMKGNDKLMRYQRTVHKLFALYNEESILVESMRIKAREIQEFTVKFTKKEKRDIDSMIENAMIILLVAFLTALLTGLMVSIRFAITVINPLLALEATTRRIAEGDFPELIVEVKGNDELASLQRSFNIMVERLHQSMITLDNAFRQLKEKQKQLVGAEKLASVGILASGIAHEISNPLTSVLTFSTLMLEKTAEDDPNKEKLSIMVRETVRAREIVRQLLTFAKETPINLIEMNVNKPVAEAVKTLTEQEVFHDIDITVNLDEDLPNISIDPDRLTQVMLNMLLNATHAIIRPGKIDVTTRRAGDAVEIIISDSGVGIPEEHLGRIFDPFFSTKEQSKGTGLGLAVSYGIIKKHGGTINVSSEVGKGTTFTVRLPINGSY